MEDVPAKGEQIYKPLEEPEWIQSKECYWKDDTNAHYSNGQDSIRKVFFSKVLNICRIVQLKGVSVIDSIKMIHFSRDQEVKGHTEELYI